MIGETVLWTLTVGLLGWAAFGWAGITLAVAFAAAHVATRQRESTLPRPVLRAWHWFVLPSLLGIALSATPILLWIILVPCLLVLWLGTPLPPSVRSPEHPKRARLAGLFVVATAVAICAVSPKHLDRNVGPAHYQHVGLGELCTRLGRNHDIHCEVDEDVGAKLLDFEIPYRMSRKDVLRKLADETGLHPWLGGCGTYATLLWGVHYSPLLIKIGTEGAAQDFRNR